MVVTQMIYFIFTKTSLPRESCKKLQHPVSVDSIFLYYYLRQRILSLSKTFENTKCFPKYQVFTKSNTLYNTFPTRLHPLRSLTLTMLTASSHYKRFPFKHMHVWTQENTVYISSSLNFLHASKIFSSLVCLFFLAFRIGWKYFTKNFSTDSYQMLTDSKLLSQIYLYRQIYRLI